MFEIFRRRALGAPGEGVSFSFLAQASGGSVRDDYAREGARVRNVNATIGGHRADRFTLAAELATRNVAVALGVAGARDTATAFIWFGALHLAVEAPS